MSEENAWERVAERKGAAEELRAEAAAALRRKEARERLIESERARLGVVSAELTRARALASEGAANAAALTTTLRRDKDQLDKYARLAERHATRAAALRKELDETYARNGVAARDVESAGKERGVVVEEGERTRREVEKVRKLTALGEAKAREVVAAAGEEGERVAALQGALEAAEEGLRTALHAAQAAQSAAEVAVREKEVLAKGLGRAGDKASAAAAALSYQRAAQGAIGSEIAAYLGRVKALRSQCAAVAGARDAAGAGVQALSDAYFAASERLRAAQLTVGALEKRSGEGREGVARAEGAVAGVKKARDACAGRLEALGREAARERSAICDATLALRALRGAIGEGDTALIKAHFDITKLEGEEERSASEVAARRNVVREAGEKLRALQRELGALRRDVGANSEALRKAAAGADAGKAAKNALTGEVDKARRVQAECGARVGALKMSMARCSAEWTGRVVEKERLVREIAVLKAKLLVAQAEAGGGGGAAAGAGGAGVGGAGATAAATHAQVVGRLGEELLRAQAELRLLGDEVERPVNLHAWRELREKQPALWDALQRLHGTQRESLRARDRLGALRVALEEEGGRAARAAAAGRGGGVGGLSGSAAGEVLGALSAELKAKRAQVREVEGERRGAAERVREWEGEIARCEEGLEALSAAYVRQARDRKSVV